MYASYNNYFFKTIIPMLYILSIFFILCSYKNVSKFMLKFIINFKVLNLTITAVSNILWHAVYCEKGVKFLSVNFSVCGI